MLCHDPLNIRRQASLKISCSGLFKSDQRIDRVARQPGCCMQVTLHLCHCTFFPEMELCGVMLLRNLLGTVSQDPQDVN